MGGPGFALGLSQGLQHAQQRQMEMQRLQLEQDFNKSRQKQMETEDALHSLQLQSLSKKMAQEAALPGQMNEVLGQPAPSAPSTTPEGVGIDRRKLAALLQAAAQAGQDPNQLLNFMALADPRIRALQQSLQPPVLKELNPGQSLVEVRPGEDMPPPQPAPVPTTPRAAATTPTSPQADLGGIQQQLQDLDQQLAATPPEQRVPLLNTKQQLLNAERDLRLKLSTMPAAPAQMSQPSTGTVPPTSRVRTLVPGRPEKTSVEESKMIAELANMYPEKMATLEQALHRSPTFFELGQFFTPMEFAQSLRAQEERQREGRLEVARQTGLDAAERQFQLAQRKEKIPEKASAGERKDFAGDLVALEQSRSIIDKFDPDFVGPYAGRYGNIKELIGNLGYDEAEFRGVVARTRNATIKAITGSQMCEPEATRIRQELPEFTLSPEAFIARMKLTYANLYEMAKVRRSIAAETGVDLSGLAPLIPPAELDPQIRNALRRQAGLTPIGAAQERTIQGQAKQEEEEFLRQLPVDQRTRYRMLSQADRAKFKERYLKKLDALPQGGR